jgi:hypothetical protein
MIAEPSGLGRKSVDLRFPYPASDDDAEALGREAARTLTNA